MQKKLLVIIAIIGIFFLSACGSLEKNNIINNAPKIENHNNQTKNNNVILDDEAEDTEEEDVGIPEIEGTQEKEETKSEDKQVFDFIQQGTDMLMDGQLLTEEDFMPGEGDEDYFYPVTDDYMLEQISYDEDGFVMAELTSFDENGTVCQYVEKRIYDNINDMNELSDQYIIVGNSAYKNTGTDGHTMYKKADLTYHALNCTIDMDNISEDGLVYYNKDAFLKTNNIRSWTWFSILKEEEVRQLIQMYFDQLW